MVIAYELVYSTSEKSSLKVLAELLRASSPAVADHVAETRTGIVAAISIPDVPNSGAIYVFDRPTASMSSLSVDGRVCDFTADEIGEMFPEVVRHMNTPSTSTQELVSKPREIIQARRPQQKHHQNNRNNNHRQQQKRQNSGAPTRQKHALVAA